jgi:hypothetical protein
MHATNNANIFSAKDGTNLRDRLETKNHSDSFEICRIQLLQHVILKASCRKNIARRSPCCQKLLFYIVYIAKERYNEAEENNWALFFWQRFNYDFCGMHPVVYLFDNGISKVSLHNNVWNTIKQNIHYCVNIRFYLRRLKTLHVSTPFLGHLQAYVNTSISYWMCDQSIWIHIVHIAHKGFCLVLKI